MSEELKQLVFSPINFKEQKEKQPESLNYEATVYELKNGKTIPTNDETGFMYHKYAQFVPKEIKKGEKLIASFKSSQRNYIKLPIYPDQSACLDFEKQINTYDDALEENRELVLSSYDKLYTHVRSVKEPKETDELDIDPNKPPKEKFNSVKMRLEMGWNYYLDGQLLDEHNSAVAKKAFFDARKNKVDPKNVTVSLTFTDEDGNETKRDVKFADSKDKVITNKIVQEKDKILTTVKYRHPESIQENAKEVDKCTEDELSEYYGESEIVKINTPEDLDKYYRNGCYIRLVYIPLKIYAQRNKNTEGKRNFSYIFEVKVIEIVNTKQNKNSNEMNKQYENYKFGCRNTKSGHDEKESSPSQTKSTTTTTTTTSNTNKTNKKVVVQEVEEEEEQEVDGEEQEDQEEQEVEEQEDQEEQEVEEQDEQDEEVEEEPVVVTKNTKNSKKVEVEVSKPKQQTVRKTK